MACGYQSQRNVCVALCLLAASLLPAEAAEQSVSPPAHRPTPRPELAPRQRPVLKRLPDLRPHRAGMGICDWLDGENRFYVRVSNAGTAAAAPSKARVEFGRHVRQFAVPAIAAGQSVSVGGVYLPQEYFDANGVASINAAVDYGSAVAESNEGNNRVSCRIRLRNVLRGMEPSPPEGEQQNAPRGMMPDPN